MYEKAENMCIAQPYIYRLFVQKFFFIYFYILIVMRWYFDGQLCGVFKIGPPILKLFL
jgi:hypothetical protein